MSFRCSFIVGTALFLGSVANAQEIAHSDVFFTFGESQILITPQNDRLSIPQVMPVGGFFAQANVNPGFFSERDVGGGTAPNDIVGYNVLDDLIFWSDGEFADPKATTEIRIINNPRTVDDTFIGTGTGEQRASFDPLSNSIGQSGSGGDFHAHVDFRLEPLTDEPEDVPSPGAYGLKLSLSSDNPLIEESDPFFIVFQFGLDGEQFDVALDDFDALLSGSPGLLGDFDSDGLLTAVDIDLLSDEVTAASNNSSFDLTDDQVVNELDRAKWVEELAGTFFGDANLDGSVQFLDFLSLASGFGNEGGWADGDFDGNGTVSFPDFLRLATNFGKGAEAAAASVPEPSTYAMAIIALYGMTFVRRQRHRCKPNTR